MAVPLRTTIQRLWNTYLQLVTFFETRFAAPTFRKTDDPRSRLWFPLLCITSAVGVLLLSISYALSRDEAGLIVDLLYWVALFSIFVPTLLRLFSPNPDRVERLALVILMGASLWSAKYLLNPAYLIDPDELMHYHTLHDILTTNHLFLPNTLLPISPMYPGLEIVTTAVQNLLNVDIVTSTAIVTLMARIVVMLGLFFLYEEVSGSDYIAGLGCAFYTFNQNFLLFDAIFGYETLALAFCILTFFTLARRLHSQKVRRIGWAMATVLCVGQVLVTHHVTTYYMQFFLVFWVITTLVRNRIYRQTESPEQAPLWTLLTVLIMNMIWLLYVATVTIGYLGAPIFQAVNDMLQLLRGDAASRTLFSGDPFSIPPSWERIFSFGAVGFLMLGLGWGLFWLVAKHRKSVAYLVMGFCVVYPATQALRLVGQIEIATRIAPFLFVQFAFVLALGASRLWNAPRPRLLWQLGTVVAIVIMFFGGVALADVRWARLPGPYVVMGDSRSVDLVGISAATRIRDILGPGNRFSADRVNGMLFHSYGEQNAIMEGYSLQDVFFSSPFKDRNLAQLCYGRISFVVSDRRFASGVPYRGWFYASNELNGARHVTPLPLAWITKFDDVPNFDRIFDDGDLLVWDVRRKDCTTID